MPATTGTRTHGPLTLRPLTLRPLSPVLGVEATGVDLVRSLRNDAIPAYLMTSLPVSDPLYIEGASRAPVLSKPFTGDQLDQFLHPK